MKKQGPAIMVLSGKDRYLLLDALDKRIGTLQFRRITRPQIRHDLAQLETSLLELRGRLADEPTMVSP